MNENDLKKEIIKNRYKFRNAGFILSFLIIILMIILSFFDDNITNSKESIYNTIIDSCMIYQVFYLANNASDYIVKIMSYIKK